MGVTDVLLVAVLCAVVAGVAILVAQQAVLSRRVRRRMERGDRRMRALISLSSSLRPVVPLPDFGPYAASPDFVHLLTRLLHETRPSLVVELGSGLSTVVIGYTLRALGRGRLVSLDHDAEYAERTRREVALHGLGDVCTVVHAPLVETRIGSETFRWYDVAKLATDVTGIDVLVVDGPPWDTGPLARYPAVKQLGARLGQAPVVVLDDANRPDERWVVERWTREDGEWVASHEQTERGTAILRKH